MDERFCVGPSSAPSGHLPPEGKAVGPSSVCPVGSHLAAFVREERAATKANALGVPPEGKTVSGGLRLTAYPRDGSEEPYHPCRYCTDRAVCHDECAKAAPYINNMRQEFARQLAERREGKKQ